ncbi:MAG: hypothetical protein M3Y21_03585 [Candidatus Eremiobacteraeota bacterium]|nr:hypothetical protein [Candidatus Eremiobacteraeota bacterium]
MRAVIVAAIFLVSLGCATASAQDAPQYKPGAWHFRSIPCADSAVIAVTPRLQNEGQKFFTAQDFEQSGVQVSFKTKLGIDPAYPNGHAGVTHYQGTPGNGIMIAERPGDRVQVCFLGAPAPTLSCDPDKDPRGRLYRVYDYRQHASYDGFNSEHICGGA